MPLILSAVELFPLQLILPVVVSFSEILRIWCYFWISYFLCYRLENRHIVPLLLKINRYCRSIYDFFFTTVILGKTHLLLWTSAGVTPARITPVHTLITFSMSMRCWHRSYWKCISSHFTLMINCPVICRLS